MTQRSVATALHEGALLLYCLGIRPPGGPSRPPTLTESDVAGVLGQAGDNGMSALLYQRLMAGGSALELPPVALEHLRGLAMRSAAQSLQIGRELAEILTAFREQGIPVIVLKGAHLGSLVYGGLAMRTMGDLDLMVPRDQLAAGEAVLARLGYAPQHDPLEQVDYACHHHTRPLGKPGALRVDLHWTIVRPTAPFDIDLDGLWARAWSVRIAGVEALVLSPEDLLLHLSLHASFDHQFRLGLRACWDVLEVVRRHREAIDWDALVQRAHRWRIGKYVYVTLRLVREMLDGPIPPAALSAVEPPGFRPEVIAWARACIFAPAREEAVSPSMAKLWTSRRLRAKLTVLAHTLCLPREVMARIYGRPRDSRLLYCYYPLRWADLLSRYGRQAWELLRGDHGTRDELRAVSQRTAFNDWLVRSEV